MVIQDNERNAFDQRPLEYELVEKCVPSLALLVAAGSPQSPTDSHPRRRRHGIRLLRVPFSELRTTLSLSPSSHALLYHTPHGASSSSSPPLEVSLVYYRTAYSPTDYYTPAEWDTRLVIERSRAIKCPSVAMQLAGAKKVQQVLASPAELAHFVPDDARRAVLAQSFTGLFPLDDSREGVEALERARTAPGGFVLKPQREGGGNNIYRGDIPPFLARLEDEDEDRRRRGGAGAGAGEGAGEGVEPPKGREGYILMDLIEPPHGVEQVLVKAGEAHGARAEVVSELGVYGVVLLREAGARGGAAEVLVNETVGHLLRTKASSSDEGGVAVGFSVIDSPLLV